MIELGTRATQDELNQYRAETFDTLRVGDRVEFNGYTRPLILIGLQGTVIKKLRSRIRVRLDHGICGGLRCVEVGDIFDTYPDVIIGPPRSAIEAVACASSTTGKVDEQGAA